MRKILYLSIIIISLFVFIPSIKAEVPDFDVVYYRTLPTGTYISGEILNATDIISCQYSLDGGNTWVYAYKVEYYGTTFCRVQVTYFNDPGGEKILMKAIDRFEQTGLSDPPAFKIDPFMYIDPIAISPSFLDYTNGKKYIPKNINVSARINRAIGGLSSCKFTVGDTLLTTETVARIDSTTYSCLISDLSALNTQLYSLTVKAYDTLGSNTMASAELEMDLSAPTSHALSVVNNNRSLSVNTIAVDSQSGIKKIKLYYSFNYGTWKPLLEYAPIIPVGTIGPKELTYTFTFEPFDGSGSYQFFTFAEDMTGNIEAVKNVSEASINIIVSNTSTAPILSTITPTPFEIILETPTVSVSTTPTEAQINEEFKAEWVEYTVDASLSLYLDIVTDNLIFTEEGVSGIRFFGNAPPNQELMLVLFSDKYEVTAVSDENGEWSAIVNEPLVAGDHSAYLYYMDSENDYYRLEKELMLTVDLDNRQVFSNITILPQSGEAAAKGLFAVLLILFGTFMIIVSVAGFSHRKMRSNAVVEIIPRYVPTEGDSVQIINQPNRYI